MTRLEPPGLDLLPEYAAALRTGWSPNNLQDVSCEQLAAIAADPAGFVAGYTWAPGRTVSLPDGSVVPRLPGRTFWIFDDGFAGSINFRYQPGTVELPPHVLGHAGYAVVPWQRRRGVATRALRALLPHVEEAGLARMMVTTDPGNVASQKVILAAGGVPAGTRPACERYSEQSVFWIAIQWPPVVAPEPR